MSAGIAPSALLQLVQQTAGWALTGPSDTPALSWRATLNNGLALQPTYAELGAESRLPYFALLIAAHYCTVATFVPTDVDARIRCHAWQECRDPLVLTAMVELVDLAASWDPTLVSARVVDVGFGNLSGHNGEWFSVRAGALGRALQTKHDTLVDSLVTVIDEELDREAKCFETAVAKSGGASSEGALNALRVACVIAHNLGDLSRVVAEWPCKGERAEQLRARYSRLGHVDSSNVVATFRRAGGLNKAMMAQENHRFLGLRKPRALRKHRDLILPMGPFFDDWGAVIATHPSLNAADRSEVIDALVSGHESDPLQNGYLRALHGIHANVRGGIERAAKELPARQLRLIAAGPIREGLGLTQERFEARTAKRARDLLKTLV